MKNKIIIGLVGSLIVIASWLMGFAKQTPLGSIEASSTYNSTTTSATSLGSAGWVAMLGQGQLGSVVVTQVGTAGYIQLWDATSTATSTYQSTDIASSTAYLTIGRPILKVDSANDVGGTLTYDLQVFKGLVVEVAEDFNGQYVVTYRK